MGATDLALTAGERAFLTEARAAADELARRRARRRRSTLAGFATLAAAVSALAVFALVLRGHARDDARLATARQLAASAQANLAVDPERSILLAIEAAETTWRHNGTMLVEAEQALHDALAASRVLCSVQGVGRKTHLAGLEARADDLNRRRFDALHFYGPGIDLTVGFDVSCWAACLSKTLDGRSTASTCRPKRSQDPRSGPNRGHCAGNASPFIPIARPCRPAARRTTPPPPELTP